MIEVDYKFILEFTSLLIFNKRSIIIISVTNQRFAVKICPFRNCDSLPKLLFEQHHLLLSLNEVFL